MSRRTRLILIATASVVGVALLALLAVNLLISADWVRDRVANRIKEQTGRELTVNGTTALLFTPGPHVVITDATFTDPEGRAGTTDFSVGRLVVDLSLMELLSRNVDSERIVLERPVFTVRLGDQEKKAEPKPKAPKSENPKPRRDVRLNDIRIEDGTVNIVYDKSGKQRRVEHINANLALPSVTMPLTGQGKFDWKEESVNFSFELNALADLREKRPARLVVALDTKAIAARFDGSLVTRPAVSGQGELSAKAHSIPSLLAWMREKPASVTGIGDGELSSHVAWTEGEITFSNSRFALEHARGQGQAVVSLRAPRPHVRAALALDYLDLNPFLASGPKAARAEKRAAPERKAPAAQTESEAPSGGQGADWFSKPKESAGAGGSEAPSSAPAEAPTPDKVAEAPAAASVQPASPAAPSPAPSSAPASFDADVNLNVRKTRVFHLEIGPSSLGLAFRDGILNATLGGMELYEGRATGTLVFDAAREVPAFNGDFLLDGVQIKSLLSDAAQVSLLEGRTKLALQVSGAGDNSEEVKSSLVGQGSIAVSDGAIEGINLSEMIDQIGAGEIPELRQGPGAKTGFTDLGGSFTIKDGIAETSNLTATGPLVKVTATGTVNLVNNTMNLLANPEIVAGPEGKRGANDLAGLSVPVRIEGPLDRPTISPEVKQLFADPEKAGKTVNQIGKALQKKFKGKPVGEAIGRILGDIKIEQRGGGASESRGEAPPSAKKEQPQGESNAGQEEAPDPEIEDLLR
ncbi:MAG: AsmA family protein [Methyloceanibacter sp.]